MIEPENTTILETDRFSQRFCQCCDGNQVPYYVSELPSDNIVIGRLGKRYTALPLLRHRSTARLGRKMPVVELVRPHRPELAN